MFDEVHAEVHLVEIPPKSCEAPASNRAATALKAVLPRVPAGE
jgi:hypothetical protein